jgi:hypothetical protein
VSRRNAPAIVVGALRTATSFVIHFKGDVTVFAGARTSREENFRKAGRVPRIGDAMLSLLKSFVHLEFLAECGRLLLLSISASYVGANVRRLAVKHGWDHHLLHLVRRLRRASKDSR